MKKESVILLCLLLGTGFGALALWVSVGIYNGVGSSSWPAVDGMIAKTISGEYAGSGLEYVRVVYQYQVGGTNYQSERLSFNPFDPRADRCALEAKAGQNVRVHYKPNKPSKSVLYNGANLANYGLAVVFWTFAGLAFYGTWRVQKDSLE
jgi:Protein of unknown function (DUF3592)